MPKATEAPLFDSAVAALRFAVNHSVASIKAPTMNTMLASHPNPSGSWLEAPTKRNPRPGAENLRGLDGAAQAGMILLEFAKLPVWPRLALLARSDAPRMACSCKQPCCSGFKLNGDWSAAVEALCLVLKNQAELSRKHGKKGYSTHPVLRRVLVECHFDPGRRVTIHDMAERVQLSTATVVAHKKLIVDFLDEEEKKGWTQLDELLQASGVVGHTP
jgi:hypothetical protein